MEGVFLLKFETRYRAFFESGIKIYEKILAENGRNLYGFLAKESFHDKLGEALKEVI